MKAISRFAIASLVVAMVAATAGKVSAERISPIRPGNPGLFYSYENALPGFMAGALDKTGFFGFAGTTGHWADMNGDGLDDKVTTFPSGFGPIQYLVNLTSPTGDISGGGFDLGTPIFEYDQNIDTPIFGDIDGDNIDDNIITRDNGTNTIFWGGLLSNFTPGFATFVGGSTFTNFSPFGDRNLGDVPYMGDMNGDGLDDRILWRPGTFEVFVDYSVPGNFGDGIVDASTVIGGVAGDQIAVGDLNDDGHDDLVVWRQDLVNHPDAYTIFGWLTDSGTNALGTGLPDFGPELVGSSSAGDVVAIANLDVPSVVVPEPASAALALFGICGIALKRRR